MKNVFVLFLVAFFAKLVWSQTPDLAGVLEPADHTPAINPANILKINKGTLKEGSDADICILDLEKPWVVKAEELKSKSKNTAIENRKLQGKVKMTLLQGEVVYSN